MTVMTYVVGKPLPAKDGVIPTGTIVDVTGWRNVEKLAAGRYIRPATQAEVESANAKAKSPKLPVKPEVKGGN